MELGPYAATLIAEKDQVCAAAHTKFGEQIGDVKFHGTLGNVQTIANFLVGKIFEQCAEDLLFPAA
jgi:hypothetical protein